MVDKEKKEKALQSIGDICSKCPQCNPECPIAVAYAAINKLEGK